MSELKVAWTIPLGDVRESKRVSRAALGSDPSVAWELVGVDASTPGGLKPFYGFKLIHTLAQDASVTLVGGSTAPSTHITPDAAIIDIHAVTFKLATTETGDGQTYGYGFVYRSQEDGETEATLHIEYRRGDTGDTWYYMAIREAVGLDQMDVTVSGRVISIHIQGMQGTYWYIPDGGTPTVVSDPGPGPRQELLPFDKSEGLAALTHTGDSNARGQILLTQLRPSETSLWASVPDKQGDSEIRRLAAGDYAFAYRLYDSATGRWSHLSEIAPIQSTDFDDSSSSLSSADIASVGAYGVLDLIFDSAVWPLATTYLYVYRSVRVQSVGPVFYAAILHPDALLKVEDYLHDDQPVTSLRKMSWWYRLQDKELVYQAPYVDSSSFEEDVPYAGAALCYENLLLLSSIRGPYGPSYVGQGPNRNLGEIRYSSLTEISPELFPPLNRYVPEVPSNEVIKFVTASGNVVGFSRDRQYHIRKEGTYIRIEEMHQGYGLQGQHAAAAVGNLIYFVTSKGVKSVDSTGQLEAVGALDHLITQEWAGSSSYVSVAYDSYASTLYIQNPLSEMQALIWFNSSTVTEVHDACFQRTFSGHWPLNDDSSLPLVGRAFFIGKQPILGFDVEPGTLSRRVFIPDYDRQKVCTTQPSAHPNTTLDLNGDLTGTVTSRTSSTSLRITTDGTAPSSNCEGSYLYFLDQTSSYFGQAVRVLEVLGTGAHTVDVRIASASTEYVGLKVGFSPIYTRWVSSGIGLQDDQGNQFGARDLFRIRHVESIAPFFSEIDGRQAGTAYAAYRGLLYSGNDTTPAAYALARDRTGVPLPAGSIVDKEATYPAVYSVHLSTDTTRTGYDGTALFPGIEIFTPLLTYRLLGVRVEGSIRDSTRTQRAT
jgi:hypothetical protein